MTVQPDDGTLEVADIDMTPDPAFVPEEVLADDAQPDS